VSGRWRIQTWTPRKLRASILARFDGRMDVDLVSGSEVEPFGATTITATLVVSPRPVAGPSMRE